MSEWIVKQNQDGQLEVVGELIRCKDCNFKEEYRGWNKWCIKNSFGTTDDDFCSWAERKEE